MNFDKLLTTVAHMNSGDHPDKLNAALAAGDDAKALRLIENQTFGDKLYRAVFWLRNRGTSVLEKEWGGLHPLRHAAETGNIPILRALLTAGADINAKNYLNWTALHYALWDKQDIAAIELINAGAEINSTFSNINAGSGDTSRYTPLHVAVRNDVGLPVIKLLIEKGAEIVVAQNMRKIIVDAAQSISDENVATIEFLLQQGADPNEISDSETLKYRPGKLNALFHALEQNKPQIAVALLSRGANVYLKFLNRYLLSPEMIETAHALCRANGLPVQTPPVEQNQNMLLFHRQVTRSKKTEINTHTASIHKTVSESAMRLQRASQVNTLDASNIAIIHDFLSNSNNLLELLKTTSEQSTSVVKTIISSMLSKISLSAFRDHESNIYLSQVLLLILQAIKKLPCEYVQHDAFLKLCEHIYYAGIEGICESGIFNTLVYSQQTILKEVIVVVHTNADATDKLNQLLRSFAKSIYDKEPCSDLEEFEAKVIAAANLEVCKSIMLNVISEFYLIFKLADDRQAAKLSDRELQKICQEFTGQDLKDLFAILDYAELFAKVSSPKNALVLA